jgi:hypothetical protein
MTCMTLVKMMCSVQEINRRKLQCKKMSNFLKRIPGEQKTRYICK